MLVMHRFLFKDDTNYIPFKNNMRNLFSYVQRIDVYHKNNKIMFFFLILDYFTLKYYNISILKYSYIKV